MRYIAILAVILLSGCSLYSLEAEDFSCPQIGFIADADRASTPAAEVVINGFAGTCSFKKSGEVQVELALPFAARKGATPAASVELPYFIAVLSPDETPLQRQAFSVKINFDNTETGSATDEHIVKIPLSSPAEAYKYKVAIGFALTPGQLQQNRKKK